MLNKAQKTSGMEFVAPLVADVVQDEPTQRQTMSDVISRFGELRKSLPQSKPRSRLVKHNEVCPRGKAILHALMTVMYIAAFRPAITSPRSRR